jgi:hypothetical protein
MTTWQIWLRIDIDHEVFFGAIGPHACASVGTYLRQLQLADAPVWVGGPPAPGLPCVVAIDAQLLAEEPSLARLLPDGSGCLLVAPGDCTDGAIDAARTALGAHPAWTALCCSGVEGDFARSDSYEVVTACADAAAHLVAVACDITAVLAKAGARHRDALLSCDAWWGADNAASISGYPLERVLRKLPYPGGRGWRRVRNKQILLLGGPLLPAFQALLDRLPRSPGGRLPFQVIADETIEPPAEDPRTFWRAIHLDWLVRATTT